MVTIIQSTSGLRTKNHKQTEKKASVCMCRIAIVCCAARSDTTDSRWIHGGPLRLVKHESPRVSNGVKTVLHGAAQQAIRICMCKEKKGPKLKSRWLAI
jgi:hypothetical protein